MLGIMEVIDDRHHILAAWSGGSVLCAVSQRPDGFLADQAEGPQRVFVREFEDGTIAAKMAHHRTRHGESAASESALYSLYTIGTHGSHLRRQAVTFIVYLLVFGVGFLLFLSALLFGQ